MLPCEIAKFPHAIAVESVRKQNAVDSASRLDRLCDGMTTDKDVGRMLFRMRLFTVFGLLHIDFPLAANTSRHISCAVYIAPATVLPRPRGHASAASSP